MPVDNVAGLKAVSPPFAAFKRYSDNWLEPWSNAYTNVFVVSTTIPTGLRPAPKTVEIGRRLPSAAVQGATVLRHAIYPEMLLEPEFVT